jgi:hypothetical protein
MPRNISRSSLAARGGSSFLEKCPNYCTLDSATCKLHLVQFRLLPQAVSESDKRQRISLHGDILRDRHTAGGIAEILPFDDFVAADYFLYLLGQSSREGEAFRMRWRPWSALYLHRAPAFLTSAKHKRIADELVKAFGFSDIDEMKKRLMECVPFLEKLFSKGIWIQPIRKLDIERIGTQ